MESRSPSIPACALNPPSSLKKNCSERGQQSEDLACRYLQAQGLKLVERNFRSRHGEIDLVMQEGDTLVFVEVRFRQSDRFGGAAASVDFGKRRRLSHTANLFLQNQTKPMGARFDVVALNGAGDIEWLRNAFEATG